MSQANSTVPVAGEKLKVKLKPQQKLFIEQRAAQLDGIDGDDVLKHFADNWWNLCQWEKQRLDVIDTKAQMLLGLSSIAMAILGTGFAEQSHGVRVIAAVGFLLTMVFALVALFVRQVGGFLDLDVFEALSASKVSVGTTPEFKDNNATRCYYRETAIQRWLVYDLYKKASAKKSGWVMAAQLVATLSVVAVAVAVCFPSSESQAQNSTTSASAAVAGSSASASGAPAIGSTSASGLNVASTPDSASSPTASPPVAHHSHKKSNHHAKQ